MTDQELWTWWQWKWLSTTTLQNFQWESPYWLYAMIGLVLIGVLKWALPTKKLIQANLWEQKVPFQWVSLLRFFPDLAWLLCMVFTLVALARPQKTDQQVEKYAKGIEIMLAADVSESMMLSDFTPNRLSVSKNLLENFIENRPEDRIGIIVFAGEAFTLVPLTTDHELLKELLHEIEYGIIKTSGTAIGDALAVGIYRLKDVESKTKVIVLISDGDNNSGRRHPLEVAELAKSKNIKIYTILAGKEGQVPYIQDSTNQQTVMVQNALDESTLKKIAQVSEGEFFRADSPEALQQALEKISSYEKSEIIEEYFVETKDYYAIYLLWAMAFFIIWLLLKSTFMNNALDDFR